MLLLDKKRYAHTILVCDMNSVKKLAAGETRKLYIFLKLKIKRITLLYRLRREGVFLCKKYIEESFARTPPRGRKALIG